MYQYVHTYTFSAVKDPNSTFHLLSRRKLSKLRRGRYVRAYAPNVCTSTDNKNKSVVFGS